MSLTQSRARGIDGKPRVRCLTIFFPMLDEAAYIRSTLAAAAEACKGLIAAREIADYELLVVDDGSSDATGRIARSLKESDPHVEVVHHHVRRGLGAALRTGFGHARGDLILYTDADLPCDLAELGKALRLQRHHEADIVSAYRHDRTGEGPRRALYSWVWNWLVRLVFGIYVRDVNFSFKLCRREIFEHLELQSEGSFVDAELLVRADRLGLRVVQFGVDYFPRWHGTSRLSSGSVISQMTLDMLRMRGELRRAAHARAADCPGTARVPR